MKKELIVYLKDIAQYFKDSLVISTISSLASFISSVGVIVGVCFYLHSGPDRQAARDLSLWANLGVQNTGKKYALQLFSNDGVAMNSIVIQNADLSGVLIPNANMTYSNICGSNLTNADLTNVDFSGATLDDNDMSYANLTGASLKDLNYSNIVYKKKRNSDTTIKNCSGGDVTILKGNRYFQGPANNNISGAILPDDFARLLEHPAVVGSRTNFNYLFCVQGRAETEWERKIYSVTADNWPDEHTDDQKNYVIWPVDSHGIVKFYWPEENDPPFCNPPKPVQAICVSSWCAQKEPYRVGRDIFYRLTVYSQPQYDISASPDTGMTPE